jgi:hypothetical protein
MNHLTEEEVKMKLGELIKAGIIFNTEKVAVSKGTVTLSFDITKAINDVYQLFVLDSKGGEQ